MTTFAVPSVKQVLKTLLEAHTWPVTAPAVRWGGPTETEDLHGEMVYFADTRDIEREYRTLGGQVMDETFNLRMHVDAIVAGDDEQGAELRAWEIAGSLVDLLDENHNLMPVPPIVARLEGSTTNQANVASPAQWLARVVVDQTVVCQIHTSP